MRKIRYAVWYIARPVCWAQLLQLILRCFRPNLDTPGHRAAATNWAKQRAVTIPQALFNLGLLPSADAEVPTIDPVILEEAKERAAKSRCVMGGAADIALLYATIKITGASHVVETGVAYGWSSLAILVAMEGRDGSLVSIDRPYPGMGNEPYIGIAVPERYRSHWSLVREPDRNGLRKAIRQFTQKLDLVHYDSDKTYWGRLFGYGLLWDALKPGGIFISDDIQDDMAFVDFTKAKGIAVSVTQAAGKYVGIGIKPSTST